jgi:hypothetical protein
VGNVTMCPTLLALFLLPALYVWMEGGRQQPAERMPT